LTTFFIWKFFGLKNTTKYVHKKGILKYSPFHANGATPATFGRAASSGSC
jgi:hypothetical protein